MRWSRPVWVFALLVTTMSILPVVAGAGVTPTGSVVVQVNYTDTLGDVLPVEGAPVYLETAAGQSYDWGCTLSDGTILFSSVPAGTYTAFTGVSRTFGCGNDLFLSPEDGRKMLQVGYGGHHGVRESDTFSVLTDQQSTIKFRARTPARQSLVCGGLWVTILGTKGPDDLPGTAGDDVINGRSGRDRINGKGGDDVLCGGGSRDRIRGGTGDDLIFGEGGNDILRGRADVNLLVGGPGFDRCYLLLGSDNTTVDCEVNADDN